MTKAACERSYALIVIEIFGKIVLENGLRLLKRYAVIPEVLFSSCCIPLKSQLRHIYKEVEPWPHSIQKEKKEEGIKNLSRQRLEEGLKKIE
ncbi:MAG: hypothetical protein AUK25_14885 [Desulfobacteraceae bacterium CG2_30_51_40]|nr:MAG: hypothetical protein AUK25_14885 [Desulfobacteraceae bacterium CG2_30_51_40]